MGNPFFIFNNLGKRLITNVGNVQAYGAGFITPRFFDIFPFSNILTDTVSGETVYSFTDFAGLNHPNHGVLFHLSKGRRNGPASAAVIRFVFKLQKNFVTILTQTQSISIPAQNSSTDFIFGAAVGYHWRLDEINEGGNIWTAAVELKIGSSSFGEVGLGFNVTNFPAGGFNSFKLGIANAGLWWISPVTTNLHWIDGDGIEHTLPMTGGVLQSPGAIDGQIYIDETEPRVGIVVNGRRHLSAKAFLETTQNGLRKSGKQRGFMFVAFSSFNTQRRHWLEFSWVDGRNYIIVDGPQ